MIFCFQVSTLLPSVSGFASSAGNTPSVVWKSGGFSSGSSGRVRGAEKHEIYAATFGGHLFTGRNEVVAKVMFLHVSVILLTGGFSRDPPQDQGEPPPRTKENTPPGTKENPPRDQGEPPRDQGEHPPPGPGRPPQTKETPPGRTLQHTVNERLVRILLECILVYDLFLQGRGRAMAPSAPPLDPLLGLQSI